MIEVRDEQEENAPSPISVTLLGIEMDVRDSHQENAEFPIEVTPSLIFIVLICCLYEFQGWSDEL